HSRWASGPRSRTPPPSLRSRRSRRPARPRAGAVLPAAGAAPGWLRSFLDHLRPGLAGKRLPGVVEVGDHRPPTAAFHKAQRRLDFRTHRAVAEMAGGLKPPEDGGCDALQQALVGPAEVDRRAWRVSQDDERV